VCKSVDNNFINDTHALANNNNNVQITTEEQADIAVISKVVLNVSFLAVDLNLRSNMIRN
jgi:hypothetical protein